MPSFPEKAIFVAAAMLAAGSSAETVSNTFKVKRVFSDHFVPMGSAQAGQYNTETMCSAHCLSLGEDVCPAFSFDEIQGSCELGHIVGDPIFDEDGKEVHVRPSNLSAETTPRVMININGNSLVDLNTRTLKTDDTLASMDPDFASSRAWGGWHKGRLLMCTEAATKICKALSLSSGTWTSVQPLPRRQEAYVASVSILDQLWLVGGNAGLVHIYEDDDWTEGPDYPHNARALAAVKISATEFLACGGFSNDEGQHKQCYKMDATAASDWAYAEAMPTPHYYFGMTTYIGTDGKLKVIVAGGSIIQSASYKVEVYDVPSGTWTSKYDLPGSALKGPGLFTVGNVVHHVGGTSVGGVDNTMIRTYDPTADTWADTGETFTGAYVRMLVYNEN